MKCWLSICIVIFALTGCGSTISEYVTKTTEIAQPIADKTKTLCVIARDLAAVTYRKTEEDQIVRVCTEIWQGWLALRAVQDMLAADEVK